MSKLIPSNTGRDRVNETRRKNRVMTGKRGERGGNSQYLRIRYPIILIDILELWTCLIQDGPLGQTWMPL